jgi:YD repeat-containing protein
MISTNLDIIDCHDSHGNCIYRKLKNGIEIWCEYDTKGNMIQLRFSHGLRQWWEYNRHGKVSRYRSNLGEDERLEYFSNGLLACCIDSDGTTTWYDRDGSSVKDPLKILLLAKDFFLDRSISHESLLTMEDFAGIST